MERTAVLALTLIAMALGAFACGPSSSANANGSGRGALPEGPGLSAKYPGDVGIAGDPAVLLVETFDEGSLESILGRWEDVSNEGGKVLALSEDVPAGSVGRHSLEMTATLGENEGGHLYRRLPRGVEQLYARCYVKFPDEGRYIHHFIHVGGYNPSTPYPQGGAGERPRGDDRATAGIEPTGCYGHYPAPGVWNFYCYWPEMKISADGKYWGNGLRPAEDVLIPVDTWQCVEVMMKLNSSPESHDGELALWIDGKLQGYFRKGASRTDWSGEGFRLTETGGEPFEGFRWRTSADLKLNFFWLLHYVTEGAYRMQGVQHPSPTNVARFDDIVVATEYIGPVVPAGGR